MLVPPSSITYPSHLSLTPLTYHLPISPIPFAFAHARIHVPSPCPSLQPPCGGGQYMHTCIHVCILTYRRVHACMHTYIQKCMHTCIQKGGRTPSCAHHVWVRACVRACVCACVRACLCACVRVVCVVVARLDACIIPPRRWAQSWAQRVRVPCFPQKDANTIALASHVTRSSTCPSLVLYIPHRARVKYVHTRTCTHTFTHAHTHTHTHTHTQTPLTGGMDAAENR